MTTVTLSNGEQLGSLGVHGGPLTYQGVTRDCLTFLFDPDVLSTQQLLEKFTAGSCGVITLTDTEGAGTQQHVYEHYTIRTGAGMGMRDLAPGGAGAVSSEDGAQPVCWVSMAQSTLYERMLLSQQETIDAMIISALEQ